MDPQTSQSTSSCTDNEIQFVQLSPDNPVYETESLCMNCQENGTTKYMLTTIPFFREIIVSSFECPHCGYKNSSVQYGGVIQDRGSKITLKVTTAKVQGLSCCSFFVR
jgi:C4-type Zn-finger protein